MTYNAPISSRRILGTPMWLFSLPIYTVALLWSWRNPRMSLVPKDQPTEHEWLRTEWCVKCEADTDHEWIQFRDEPVVTRTCLDCEHESTYWDAV